MKVVSRFHFFYSLQYIRYAFLLSVVPLIRALLEFDLAALWVALVQDGFIFIAVMCFSLLQWAASGYWYSGKRILIQEGLLFRRQLAISRPMVAALELRQPLYCRLFGACQVKIYYKYRKKPVFIWLWYREATTMAQQLLPLKRQETVFRAVGAERLSFSVLSANLVTTGVLVVVSAKRTTELFGEELNKLALSNLERVEKLIEQVLPVGLAWFAALIFVLASVAFFISFLHTAGFFVCRNNGVIVAKGGLLTKTERRILAKAVTSCDIRTTPMGRLLRHSSVYLHAGGFSGKDLPLMVYRKGKEAQLQKLMPEFHITPLQKASFRGRSLLQFIWLSGSVLLLLLSMTAVSAWLIPELSSLLSIPCMLVFISLLVSLEGFFVEDVRRGENRTLELCYTQFLTRHRVYVFTRQMAFQFSHNPLLDVRKRCNFHLRVPCGLRFRVRCVPIELKHSLSLIF